MRNACVCHLRTIHAAMISSAKAHGYSIGSNVYRRDIQCFFHVGGVPKCPSGADYGLPTTYSGYPTCPVHGDVLTAVDGPALAFWGETNAPPATNTSLPKL